MSQTLQSVLCITTNKYLVRVLVVLLHGRFSVVGPIPFLLAAIFFPVHPYIGSTTVLPDITPRPSLQSYTMHAGRGGVIYREYQSVIASHSCFCSFFTSHPYILSKYLQNVFIY